jgi:hypothetical protein
MSITSYTVAKAVCSRQGNVRTYTIDFVVRTDSASDGPVLILADSRTFAKGAPYDLSAYVCGRSAPAGTMSGEKDLHCFCDSVTINPRADKNHMAWTVQAVFSNVDFVPKLSWSFLSEEQVAEYAYANQGEAASGNAPSALVLDSATQKFDPPLMKGVRYIEFKVNQNELSASGQEQNAANLIWTTNQNTWWIFPSDTVLITDINSTEQTDKGQVFFATEYKFLVKQDLVQDFSTDGESEGTHTLGHAKRVLDQGCLWYDATVGAWKLPVDANGVAHTAPVLLDGTGKKLPFGKHAQFLEFVLNASTDWRVLPIEEDLDDLKSATQAEEEAYWYGS